MQLDILLVLSIHMFLWTKVLPGLECTFSKVMSAANYEIAERTCNKQGYELPTPAVMEEYVHKSWDGTGRSLWMKLQKHDLMNWMTIDGDKFAPTLIEKGSEAPAGQDCAIIHFGDEIVNQFHCNKRMQGYACKRRRGVPCPHDAVCTSPAWQDYGDIMLFRCPCTWYQAYQYCIKRKTSLATFSLNNTKILFSSINKDDVEQKSYYVGIIRTIWTSKKENWSVSDMLTRYNWEVDEPHKFLHCAVVAGKHARWKAVDCTELHHFVCYHCGKRPLEITTGTLRTSFEAKEEPTGQMPSLQVILIVVVVIVLVMIFIALVVGIIVFRHRARQHGSNRPVNPAETPGDQPLVPKDSQTNVGQRQNQTSVELKDNRDYKAFLEFKANVEDQAFIKSMAYLQNQVRMESRLDPPYETYTDMGCMANSDNQSLTGSMTSLPKQQFMEHQESCTTEEQVDQLPEVEESTKYMETDV